jgi:phosphoglycolate phosphatase-like HAD superfamily hydrolase
LIRRLYLFDIDGTLLDAHGAGRAALDDAMHALHGVATASAGVRFGGRTDPSIVEEMFAARLGRAPTVAEREAVLDAYVARLPAELAARGVVVLAGAIAALDYLADRAALGVATGNIRAGAHAKLAAAGLADRFALGGYGCDSPLRPELVATAIRRAGAVDEVIVVGDTIHDIAAARACGAVAVAVATGADPAERLAHADAVLATLAELPAWHAARCP